MKKIPLLLLFIITFSHCDGQSSKKKSEKNSEKKYAVSKTNAEWKEVLSPMAYYVLREAGTERAFTGEYYNNYTEGEYHCAACNTLLYASKHKFKSGTGWPSFDRGIKENLEFDVDYKLGYARTELKCATCGGHLGHLFNDGPRETTGERHCINSAALTFVQKENTDE